MSRLRPLLRRWGYRVAFLLGDRRVVHGIPVSFGGLRRDAALAHRRVSEALDMIRHHSPVRFRELAAHLRGILIGGNERAHHGQYIASERLCVLTIPYVTAESTSPIGIARTLVHESKHARLYACGITYRAGDRARIELICTREEFAFIRRVPDVDRAEVRAIEDACAWLENVGESAFSDQRFYERAEQSADENRVPRWLARLVLRSYRRRMSDSKPSSS